MKRLTFIDKDKFDKVKRERARAPRTSIFDNTKDSGYAWNGMYVYEFKDEYQTDEKYAQLCAK